MRNKTAERIDFLGSPFFKDSRMRFRIFVATVFSIQEGLLAVDKRKKYIGDLPLYFLTLTCEKHVARIRNGGLKRIKDFVLLRSLVCAEFGCKQFAMFAGVGLFYFHDC